MKIKLNNRFLKENEVAAMAGGFGVQTKEVGLMAKKPVAMTHERFGSKPNKGSIRVRSSTAAPG